MACTHETPFWVQGSGLVSHLKIIGYLEALRELNGATFRLSGVHCIRFMGRREQGVSAQE